MTSRTAVGWSALEAAASGCFSMASAFLIARLIGPAELGVGAAAVSVHVLFWVGVNALFADAMVQRATMDDSVAASAFWASCLIGVAAGVAQAVVGFGLRAAVGDGRLVAMSLVLGAVLPAVGAAGAVQGLLTRNSRYKLLAGRTVIGQGAGTAIGIACALKGAGAWSMVAQQATTSLVGALVLLLRARWRPGLTCRWDAVRDMLALGGPLTISTLVLHGRYRVFAVLIGGTAGPAVLGEVHLAFRLVDTVRELASTALWRLMLPAMSREQGERERLLGSAERWQAWIGAILFPVCAMLFVAVGPLTQVLLGPAWAEAGGAARLLAVLAAWSFLLFPAGVCLVALGRPNIALRANLASCAVLLAGALVLHPASARAAVWLWLAAQAGTGPYTLWRCALWLGVPVGALLRAGARSFVLSAVCAGAAVVVPGMLGGAGQTAAWVLVQRVGLLGVLLVLAAPVLVPGWSPLVEQLLGCGGRIPASLQSRGTQPILPSKWKKGFR